jgi:hypothetical protein
MRAVAINDHSVSLVKASNALGCAVQSDMVNAATALEVSTLHKN